MKGRIVTADAYAFALSKPRRTTSNNTQGTATPCWRRLGAGCPCKAYRHSAHDACLLFSFQIECSPIRTHSQRQAPLPLICHPDIA